MDNLGTARGSIELDFGKMATSVKQAVRELEKIDTTSKRTDAEIKLMQSTLNTTGNAFKQAAAKSQELAVKLDAAKGKVKVYEQEMKLLKTQMEDSKRAQSELADKINAAKSKYNDAAGDVQKMSNALKDSQQVLEQTKAVYGEHAEATQRAKDAVKAHADELAAAKKTQKDYADEVSALEQTQKGLNNEMQMAHGKLDQFETDCTNAKADVNNLNKELAEAQNYTKVFGQYLQDAGDKISKVGKGMGTAGRELTTHVSAPLIAAGGAATKMAMDVSDSEAKLSTIADETAVSLQQLAKDAREVSDDTSASWADINDAMYQYISATGDTVGASESASTAVKAAIGGFTDATTAIDGLTSVTNAYGLQGAEHMQKVADMMLQTQNVGKTTFGELAQYIGQIAPIAHEAGIPLEQLFGAIAATTASGLKTGNAVTGLKAALSNIIKPSQEAAETAAALGIQWDAAALSEQGFAGLLSTVADKIANASPAYAELAKEAAGYAAQQTEATEALQRNEAKIEDLKHRNEELSDSMRELRAQKGGSKTAEYLAMDQEIEDNKRLMADLKEENKDLTAAQKELGKSSEGVEEQMSLLAEATDSPISAYSKLFGSVEGLNAAMVLASDDGAAKWAEFSQSIVSSSGATEAAFKKMTDTDAGKMRNDLNRMKNTAVDVGKKLLPIIEKVLGHISNLVDKFSELDDEQQNALIKAGLAAAAAGPVLSVLGSATKSIGGIVSGTGKLVGALGKAGSAATAAGAAAKGAAGAFGAGGTGGAGLGGALGALASPAGALLALPGAFYAVAGAVDYAYGKAEDADFDGRFGDIKLTADEAREAAENLTEQPWAFDLYTNVTGASAEEIQSAMGDIYAEAQKQAMDETIEAVMGLKVQLENGEIDEETFEATKKELEQKASEKLANIAINQVTATVSTLRTVLPEVTDSDISEFRDSLYEKFDTLMKDYESGELDYSSLFNGFRTKLNLMLDDGADNVDFMEKQEILRMLDKMKPQIAQMEQLADEYRAAGKALPEELAKGLSDVTALRALSGDADAAIDMLAEHIGESDSLQGLYNNIFASGRAMPDYFVQGMKEKYPEMYAQTVGIWQQLVDGDALDAETLKDTLHEMGFDAAQELIDGLAGQDAAVQLQAIKTLAQVHSGLGMGVAANADGVKGICKAFGMSIPDSVAEGIAAQEQAVQLELIQAMLQLPGATEQEQARIQELMRSYGIEDAQAYTQAVKDETDGKHVGDVEVGIKTDPKEAARSWLQKFRDGWNGFKSGWAGEAYTPQTYAAEPVPRMAPAVMAADMAAPAVAMAAPVALYDNRAEIAATMAAASVTPPAPSESYVSDIADRIAQQIAVSLQGAQIAPQVTVEMTGGDIVLNGEKVGRQVTPTVSRIIAQQSRR